MKHHIIDEDISIVTDVLKGDFLTQGPYVKNVEESMSQLTDKKNVSKGYITVSGASGVVESYHSELIKRGKHYANMVNAQNKNSQ